MLTVTSLLVGEWATSTEHRTVERASRRDFRVSGYLVDGRFPDSPIPDSRGL